MNRILKISIFGIIASIPLYFLSGVLNSKIMFIIITVFLSVDTFFFAAGLFIELFIDWRDFVVHKR